MTDSVPLNAPPDDPLVQQRRGAVSPAGIVTPHAQRRPAEGVHVDELQCPLRGGDVAHVDGAAGDDWFEAGRTRQLDSGFHRSRRAGSTDCGVPESEVARPEDVTNHDDDEAIPASSQDVSSACRPNGRIPGAEKLVVALSKGSSAFLRKAALNTTYGAVEPSAYGLVVRGFTTYFIGEWQGPPKRR